MKYNRVLLKLSGKALAGDDKTGINAHTVADIARQIKDAKDLGVEIAIVCGGGNLWRGKTGADMGMDRSSADYMGMLATVMNGLAVQNALEAIGVQLVFFERLKCVKLLNHILEDEQFVT